MTKTNNNIFPEAISGMKRRMYKIIICGFLLVCGTSLAFADSGNSFKTSIPPSYENRLKSGIDAFYKSDWKEARRIFDTLIQEFPEDSRAYFFRSMIPFWKYYFVEKSGDNSKKFLDYSEIALEKSQAQLENNSRDTTMVLMLSGLYGYRSLVAASEKEYRVAVQSGMEGFQYTRQLLALDSNDPKALIGKGMFYYMIGSIPGSLKWVTNLVGFSGNMEEGFEALEKAALSESYIHIDAKMILAYLYEREGMFKKAEKTLKELTDSHPKNVIFHYRLARILEKNGKMENAKSSYNSVIRMENKELGLLISKSKERLRDL